LLEAGDAAENGGMTEKRTREEIEDLLRRYRSRGSVTRRAFCESEGISLPSLDYYLRRWTAPAVRLAQVNVARDATANGRFTLVLANGRRIECGQAELAELIAAAERA
jgi:hypothetical protein